MRRHLRAPNDRPPGPPSIRRSPRADLRLTWSGGVTGYEGRIRLGGVATGWASIADVCGATWEATVSELDGCDVPPGLVTVELLDGPRRGLFAFGDLEHPELIVDAHHPGAEVTVYGRCDFGPPLA